VFHLAAGGRWGRIAGFDGDGLVHGFSTRRGGVSAGPYESLNVGLYSGDKLSRVVANREILFHDAGVPLDWAVFARQVHGTAVAAVGVKERGAGARDPGGAIGNFDGMITGEADVILTAMGADCPPVYFFDPVQRAVGIVHAGWRGVAGGVAVAAVQALVDHCGSRPEHLHAAVGPGIGPCCFQVGDDVAAAFRQPGLDAALREDGDRWRADLTGALRHQLEQLGLKPERVWTADVCTRCRSDLFFSYRRQRGAVGSMVAWIGLGSRAR